MGISKIISYVTWISASCALLISAQLFPPQGGGDSWEYALTTEAIRAHGTPNVQEKDIESLIQYSAWGRELYEPFLKACHQGEDTYLLFFKNSHGTYCGAHFWLYPLLNAPVKQALLMAGRNHYKHFQMTNALIAIVLLGYVLIYSRQSIWYGLVLSGSFMLTGGIFYLYHPHAEFFIVSAVLISGTALLDGRYNQAIFWWVLAAMQNMAFASVIPLLWFAAMISLYWQEQWRQKSLKWKLSRIAIPTGIAACAGLPMVYYYLTFSRPSLLTPWSDMRLISWRRLQSLLFDLNQGGVIGYWCVYILMALLLAHCILRIGNLWRTKATFSEMVSGNKEHLLLLFPFLVAILMLAQSNWNSGYVFFMRYAFLACVPFLLWVACRIQKSSLMFRCILIIPAMIFMSMWVFYVAHYETNTRLKIFKPARIVLDTFPGLYNPEPEIFLARETSFIGSDHLVSVYKNAHGTIMKALVWKPAFEKYAFISKITGKTVDINNITFFTCVDQNKVMDIECLKCVDQYFGYVSGPMDIVLKNNPAAPINGSSLSRESFKDCLLEDLRPRNLSCYIVMLIIEHLRNKADNNAR